MIDIPAGMLSGFKALSPEHSAAVSVDPPSVLTDWAAVYPQPTLQSALNYLPNQWDRGQKTAHIVSMHTRQPVKLLVYSDPAYMLSSASSQQKAYALRAAYSSLQGQARTLPELPNGPLMTSLGHVGVAACVYDAEDFELIVPHALFNKQVFRTGLLFTVHQSDMYPASVGSVEGLKLERHKLHDLKLLGKELSKVTPVTSCQALQQLIQSALADPSTAVHVQLA
jgi:hypothetical protein